MRVEERVPLSAHTTFRIGGPAALRIIAETEDEIREAYALAHSRGRVPYLLGAGSNVLAADAGTERAMLSLGFSNISYEEEGERVLAHADAGVPWDALVTDASARGLWGIENLAGIPGTVGAAPVQNIGAYGREVADVLVSVRAYDPAQDAFVELSREECAFGYRDSRFKRAPGMCITRVTLALSRMPSPQLGYPDLQERIAVGDALDTPERIARAVREIRAAKFPDLAELGTAGSFFKNPVIPQEQYDALAAQYPSLPGFPQEGGVKVPLAWILDRVLGLRGHAQGSVWLFERQPLVLVAARGATAHDVDALAAYVHARVEEATGISIEREVQSLA